MKDARRLRRSTGCNASAARCKVCWRARRGQTSSRSHQNAQLLLRPLAVVNPYADRLTFLADRTRARRDHEKYLTLIDAIALLHQHQRPIRHAPGKDGGTDIAYVEVTVADIAHANRLAHEVLGRSLDALPPQTRRLLGLIADGAAGSRRKSRRTKPAEVRFTRRELREATGWGDTQLKLHLARLVELEHLLVHRAERGQGFVYELLYDGDGSAAPHLSGLIDPATLVAGGYDGQWSGVTEPRSAAGRPVVGARSAGGQGEAAAKEAVEITVFADPADIVGKTHVLAGARLNGSHRKSPVAPAALAAAS